MIDNKFFTISLCLLASVSAFDVFASGILYKRGVSPHADSFAMPTEDVCESELIQRVITTAKAELTNSVGITSFFIENSSMCDSFKEDFSTSFERQKKNYDKLSFVRHDDEILLKSFIIGTYADMPFFKKLEEILRINKFKMRLEYPFEYVSLQPTSCLEWCNLGKFQDVFHPRSASVLVKVFRKVDEDLPASDLSPVRILGILRSVTSHDGSFEPIGASYNLKTILGIAYKNKHTKAGDGEYCILDSTGLRRVSFPRQTKRTMVASVISGDGNLIGYDEYDEDFHSSEAWVMNGTNSFIAIPTDSNVHTRITGLSFDGTSVLCEYRDSIRFPGPRTALRHPNGTDLLNPFGSDSVAAIACCGNFISSNGCVIAGRAFDADNMKTIAFVKSADKDMVPLFGPVHDDDFLWSEVLAMSHNGKYIVGRTGVASHNSVLWGFNGHSYRRLSCSLRNMDSFMPRFISDTGQIIVGVVADEIGRSEPVVISGEEIGTIKIDRDDISIIDIVSVSEDGHTILCKAFRKKVGEIAVFIDYAFKSIPSLGYWNCHANHRATIETATKVR